MDTKHELFLEQILKIQEALRPLGYEVTGGKEKRGGRIILQLLPYRFRIDQTRASLGQFNGFDEAPGADNSDNSFQRTH